MRYSLQASRILIKMEELILHTDDFLISLVRANLTLTYFILFTIIFCESAFLLFFFFPGDGLLFSVGVISAATRLELPLVIPLLITAAISGYMVNYWLGTWSGHWLLNRRWHYFLKFHHKAHDFMEVHGSKAIIISRFFPIVRTFLPFVAGMVDMNYKKFVFHTCLGAIIWVLAFTLTGHFVGSIPWVSKNYGLIFFGLTVITLLPLSFPLLRAAGKRIGLLRKTNE